MILSHERRGGITYYGARWPPVFLNRVMMMMTMDVGDLNVNYDGQWEKGAFDDKNTGCFVTFLPTPPPHPEITTFGQRV